MTIRIEPHFRLQILPNVGGAVKEDGMNVYAEVRNNSSETISSANIVVVAYGEEGTLIAVEESSSYLTLRSGETKAVKIHVEADPQAVTSLRLYAETEYDDDDPGATDPALEEPPTFMAEYLRNHPKSE